MITNDPYCGGQHIPDILAFRAVFADGVRVAIVGTLCHHLDMGGISAGSYGATATEIFQEGLRIPPMKLLRARRDEQRGAGHDAPERPPPRHAVGRPPGAARLPGRGRGQPAPPRRPLRRAAPAGRLRPAAGRLRARHARHDRPHPGRPLRVRGLHRRRRPHRRPDPHPRPVDHRGRRDGGRPLRLRRPGARADQRHARLLRLRRVVRRDGVRRRPDPGQRRLLPPGPRRRDRRARSCTRATRRPSPTGSPRRTGWPPPCSARCTRRCRTACRPPITAPATCARFQTIAADGDRGVLVEIEVGGGGGASGAGRRQRLFQRHAQQRQHPGRDDRERTAADHRRIRPAARHGRRRPLPRRPGAGPGMADRLPGGRLHRQPGALQAPPLRPRRRRTRRRRPPVPAAATASASRSPPRSATSACNAATASASKPRAAAASGQPKARRGRCPRPGRGWSSPAPLQIITKQT